MILHKSKTYGILGTFLIHLLIIACLILFGFTKVEPTTEEGLAVNFGNIDEAAGLFEPAGETTNTEPVSVPEPASEAKSDEALVTQNHEQSVALTEKKEKESLKKESQIQKEQDRKAATIRNQAASAFGTSSGKSQGTSSKGIGNQGVPSGNSNTANSTGSGTGYGHFSLNGRSLNGGLPRPSYSIQEEGTVVVQISVSPKGNVTSASISLHGTNSDNSTLRNAALSAAKQAKFNIINGNQNQSGTITYRFRLK